MTIRTDTNRSYFSAWGLHPAGLLAVLLKADGIWRERQKLARLDAHILNDIGISPEEAQAETRRGTWDAPNRWLR